jgi:hypothetical protein
MNNNKKGFKGPRGQSHSSNIDLRKRDAASGRVPVSKKNAQEL